MYLIFDTETTGLPINDNAPLTDLDNWPRLVQISWQLHDEDGRLIDNQDFIIRPEGFDIPYSSTRVHGITTEMALEQGADIREVLATFREVLKKTTFAVGHNLKFDYNVVGPEFLRLEQDNPLEKIPVLDTMLLGTEFAAIATGREGKMKPPKLGELYAKLFSEPFDEAHNAAADVNATARIFFELIRVGAVSAENSALEPQQVERISLAFPEQVQAFPIKVRSQVAAFKEKSRSRTAATGDVDLGSYFNFHNHSIFSALQSNTTLQDLVNHAVANQFPAVGMVDFGNLMGAFKFVSEVEKINAKKTEAGEMPLIPVLGCEFYISDRPEQKQFTKEDPDRRTQTVLLAKNAHGYQNLAKLSSIGYLKGFYFGVPRISKQNIAEYREDLIALTGSTQGDVPQAILQQGEQRAEEVFRWWSETFADDFYVQIQNHGTDEEEYVNGVLLRWAEKYGVKVLAQNETYYTQQDDAPIQDILFCIKDGEKLSSPVGKGFGKRRGLPTREYYLKDRKALAQTFGAYPQAFEAYDDFLSKFQPYSLKRDVLLPKFDIPAEFQHPEDAQDGGKRGENAYLRHLTYEGARERYGEITPEISERLDFELQVIANTGYPGYFLIVQDFCNEARRMGVSVGPGRGSAAGSAVAYCTGITNVDPIKYDLLFERFLNPERISMPDIDIDFDDEGRDRVIRWVIEKYGQMNVAQIITYSVLGGKSAIKDAGRVLDIPIPDTNNIARLVPASPGMNIAKALSKYDKLMPEDKTLVDEMKRILSAPDDEKYPVLHSAQKLEGAIRNTGIHACGVIITPEDVSNLVPVTTAKDSDILVSQFDNSVAESAGLLKMDFLGLRTLTIIKDALKLIKDRHGIDLHPDDIPLDDKKTYQLFQEGRTVAIFQYESPGMQKYMRELKPTVFADLIAMNALYRPGPIKYIPDFIRRKHGLEEIVYDLPETEEYLAETYGITVYQEQVMLLSQKLANFTKGEADTLRKAMGKKQKDVLDKMYPKFLEGGRSNNLDEEKLNKIWKDWEAFAEYAFNKSHSTCYALIAYHTAYLKANYPAEYMASVMSNNVNNTKQITMFMEDCKTIGVDVLGPDVNESEYTFNVNDKGQIRFGLGAIKGIGEGPSEAIVESRKKGKFKNVYDFFERVPYQQLNKRVAESLVLAGALDSVDKYHRAQYLEGDQSGKNALEKLARYAQNFQDSHNDMQHSLFADFAEEVQIETPKIPSVPQWQTMYSLNREKEIIGFYLSAHPLDEFNVQYRYVSGDLGPEILNKEIPEEELAAQTVLLSQETLPEATPESEDAELPDMPTEDAVGDEISDPARNVTLRGSMRFLQLDELDAYREKEFGPDQIKLFEAITDYRDKQKHNANLPEITVAGLVTAFDIRDGRNSGEQVAFLTLEDYSGSYQFRIGDRDLLKLRDKIGLQRFLVLKLKFSIAKDSRVFVNVQDALELKTVLEDCAKKLTIRLNPEMVNENTIKHISGVLQKYRGEQSVNFLLERRDAAPVALPSKSCSVLLNRDLVKDLEKIEELSFYIN